MHRWFYANEELICDLKKEESEPSEIEIEAEQQPEKLPIRPQKKRKWRFCVTLKDRDLLPNEAVAVSGNCDDLGNWNFYCCIIMTPVHENCADVWHVYVDIPAERDISYRYLIVAVDPDCDQKIVRFFESHRKTRKVPTAYKTVVDVCEDIFGLVNESQKIERGWLTTERIVQFKFFKAPFEWNSPPFSGNTFYVKVTPFFRKNLYECLLDAGFYEDSAEQSLVDSTESKTNQIDEIVEEKKKQEWPMICGKKIPSFTKLNFSDSEHTMSISYRKDEEATEINESTDIPAEVSRKSIKLSTAFAFNEVANTFEDKNSLKYQPPYGTQCNKEDLITVHLTIGDFKNTIYLIELYKYSKNASNDEYPYRVGYRYVLPEDFQTFEHGYMQTPIVCASKHRPIGSMKFGFTIIHPHPTLTYDLSVSYLRYWNEKRTASDIGHRGQGKTYSSENKIIYENTLYSMKQAISNGADYVEFDVQLTKDLVPVIYHDFNVHVAKHNNTLLQNFNNINKPLTRFNYEALMNLRISESNAETLAAVPIGDAEKRLQLFPKLLETFDNLDENIGFDIELKWPQQLCDHKYEEGVHPIVDRNIYVDRILEVVFQNARRRRIVFSSFDADICMQLRFKQNRYPVMLLLHEEYKSRFLDPRVRTPLIAANFAYTMELLGVIPHANILKGSPTLIKEILAKNLVTFCYGIEVHEEIQDLKKAGVRAVIIDRMDEYAKLRRLLSSINVCLGGGDE